MDHQDIQKILTAKRQQRLSSESASTTASNSDLKSRPQLKSQAVDAPDSKELESEMGQRSSETTTAVEQQLELNFEMPSQESGHLESLAEADRGGSLFDSGWEYGHLLKELRF